MARAQHVPGHFDMPNHEAATTATQFRNCPRFDPVDSSPYVPLGQWEDLRLHSSNSDIALFIVAGVAAAALACIHSGLM